MAHGFALPGSAPDAAGCHCVLQVTYHGPGQLVLYPILDLRRFTPDLHWYMRRLEDVAMRCAGWRGGAGQGGGEWCVGS